MLSHEQARARVARGASHLDRIRPGWWNRVDVGTLTLHDTCGCVLGQLGRFEAGEIAPFMRACRALVDGHGFDIEDIGCFTMEAYRGEMDVIDAYRPLQDAWVEAIADRRLAAVETRGQEPVSA